MYRCLHTLGLAMHSAAHTYEQTCCPLALLQWFYYGIISTCNHPLPKFTPERPPATSWKYRFVTLMLLFEQGHRQSRIRRLQLVKLNLVQGWVECGGLSSFKDTQVSVTNPATNRNCISYRFSLAVAFTTCCRPAEGKVGSAYRPIT